MNTQDLIAQLAQQASPVNPRAAQQRYTRAVACGAALSLALVLSFWGVNPTLATLAQAPAFWVKLLWLALVCAFAAPVVWQLAHPQPHQRWQPWGLGASLLGMGVLALWQVSTVDSSTGVSTLVLGSSWQLCSASIMALAVPLLAALLWMLRGMAPTRPALAGASAGLMAAGVAGLLYALHCPETAYPFLAIWYGAGMAVMAALGAGLGKCVLRW